MSLLGDEGEGGRGHRGDRRASHFHETFGVYADGVEITTATLPPGREERAVLFDTPMTKPGRAVCLEPHDLAAVKLVRMELTW